MAIESVPNEQDETEHGPDAFACFDSSIFRAWAKAVADLLSAVEDSPCLDRHTLANAGALMFSLLSASGDLADIEARLAKTSEVRT